MESNKQEQINKISFIDLFAVLLRYRKLIIGITLCGVVLAIAGYFIYPAYQHNRAQKNTIVEGNLVIGVKQLARPWLPEGATSFFNSPESILAALQQAGFEYFEDEKLKIPLADQDKRSEELFYIRQRLIKNEDPSGKVYSDPDKKIFEISAHGDMEIMFKYKDAALVVSFLEKLLIQGEIKVSAYIRPLAMLLVDSYERYLTAETISESIKQILERDFNSYLFAKAFLAGEETVLMEVAGPELIRPEISLEMFRNQFLFKGVMLFFAMFFLAVFLAFLLDAVQEIKHDEDAMKKIRDALGKTGGK